MATRLPALLLLLAVLAHDAHAGLRIRTADGVTVDRELPSRADDRVIVEFHEQPLLARSPRRLRTDAAALDSLQTRLTTDLARIGGSLRVEQRYRLTFAGASVRVGQDALPAVRALSYVKAVHPDRRVNAALETTVPHIGAPEVWERLRTRGRGITVAIIDTGIDYTHPALGGAFGAAHKVIGGYDFVNGDADPMDDHGHGTHVAGIVAGAQAPVVGVAPEAALLAYKVLDAHGYGFDSEIIAAIEHLLDPDGNGDPADRADVVNMSLGRFAANDDPLVSAVEQATAAGVVFCIAAGNSGGSFTVNSPGVAPSVISVGASDRADEMAGFSSRGPLLHTWSVKPEVTAPGVDVASSAIGGGTFVASGTSMAAPHAAGLAALIRELHPDWTPADVKSAIVATARPMPSVLASGAGRIDAVRAMETTLLPSPATLAFGIVGAKSGEWKATRTFRLTNRGAAPRSLTIRAEVPSGTSVTVSRPTLLLLPGAARDVDVELTVNVGVATPTDQDIALAGRVIVDDGSSSVHVPWTALTGNLVVAAYRGPGDVYVALFQEGYLLGEGNGAAGGSTYGGKIDVFALSLPRPGEKQRLIVRESQAVDGPTVIELAPEEAKHDIVIESIAENGEKLSDLGSPSRGGQWWVSQTLRLPSGVEVGHMTRAPQHLVSALTDTKIDTVEQELHIAWARKPDGQFGYESGAHVAALRSLTGLQQSETLSAGAGDWTNATIEHPCSTVCSYEVHTLLGGTELLTTAFGGSRGSRSAAVGLAGKTADGRLPGVFFTVLENDHPSVIFAKGASLISPRFHAVGGKIVAQSVASPWPLDYAPPAGDATLPYGYGPSLLRTTMGIRWNQEEFDRPGDEWSVKVTPSGMIGEEYSDDALRLRIALFDAAGRRYDGVRVFSDNYRLSEPMGDGPHRLEIVQDYRIGRTRGVGTLTSTIDKATSATAPTLTSLRIEDGDGRATFELQPDEPARLVFAGRQSTYFPYSNAVHTSIYTFATKVWWRPHPGTEWHPLPVAFLGTDETAAADPIGSMFSVDLRSITAHVRAGVALKIELTSEHGTTSWTLEPAFFVSGVPRRRSMR